ncbi:hypothetical protein R5W23_004754 [Gemmata sp. JC673]|uniref:Cadherin repeat domain-containing protein n=1 Tax=Gemmata algarum TaxID=2975278 RepID=A0ABU5F7T2_9BACT|nr:hypothetical protein [Gemmata algarum]MDY3563254.1 hypothetical protein [Gemmata algarum]
MASVLLLLAGAAVLSGTVMLARHLLAPAEKNEPAGVEMVPTPERPAESAEVSGPKRPPAAPLIPGPVDREHAVALQGPIAAIIPGGGGRYFAAHVPSAERVIVYDTALRKVAGEVPGSSGTALMAAGRESLFVGRDADTNFIRWDFKTARQDAVSLPPRAQPLRYVAMGAASDGPMVLVTKDTTRGELVLVDPATRADRTFPIDDVTSTFPMQIPYRYNTNKDNLPKPVPSSDGRAIVFRNGALIRDGARFRALILSTPTAVRPAADGRTFLNRSVFSDQGLLLQPVVPVTENHRRLLPAISGPFHVALEQNRVAPVTPGGPVRLTLYSNGAPGPLGSLPVPPELRDWVLSDRKEWVVNVEHHLFFAPDPGVLLFHPPGADWMYVHRVDMESFLDAAGGGPLFTTTPPAEVFRGRPFTYQARAIAKGDVSYWQTGGPSGMHVSPEGLITWPASVTGTFAGSTVEMRVTARDQNRRETVQTFKVVLVNPPKAPPK